MGGERDMSRYRYTCERDMSRYLPHVCPDIRVGGKRGDMWEGVYGYAYDVAGSVWVCLSTCSMHMHATCTRTR